MASLLLAAPPAAVASGGAGEAGSELVTALTIVLLRPSSAGPESTPLSTWLPMEIVPYLWNRFTSAGAAVETYADERYRQVGSPASSTERVGELEAVRVDLRIATPRGSAARSTTVRVTFELPQLLGADGSIRIQPGQYALMQAIRDSGRKSGQARVLAVERTGSRGFTAQVALQ